ncbi:MAG: hypothetical protein ABIB79_03420 [archaeon]
MKIKVPVIKNEIYSKILFSINTRKVYASELASELHKSQATIQKHLTYLVGKEEEKKTKKKGYLVVIDHPKKEKNIKLFFVNFSRIIYEFHMYHVSQDREGGYAESFSNWYETLNTSKRRKLMNLNQNMKFNKFFMVLFSEINKKNIDITLEDLFISIPSIFIRQMKSTDQNKLQNLLKKDPEFFDMFYYLLSLYTSEHPRFIYESVKKAITETTGLELSDHYVSEMIKK